MNNTKKGRTDTVLVIASILAVSLVIFALLINPEGSLQFTNMLFAKVTKTFSSTVQLFDFLCVIVIAWIAFSKTGGIRLGSNKPQYSDAAWMFMFICAGLGSATMYFAIMEWGFYYTGPGLDIAPNSPEALRNATSFIFFHWGITPWAVYALLSIAMCWHFYIKKDPDLKLSAMIANALGIKKSPALDKTIDVLFVFATFGGLILTNTMTVKTASSGFAGLLGINDSFLLQFVILAIVTAIFSFSSFVGLSTGMQKLAKASCIFCFIFAGLVLILGNTTFIIDNIVNSLGLTLSNYLHMSLYNDGIYQQTTFNQSWTAFYWLFWITYTPAVSIFVTKISEGRTIRQVILGLIIGGCAGLFFFFGCLTGYSIDMFHQGIVDVPAFLSTGTGEAGVLEVIRQLPAGTIFAYAYFLLMLIWLASHMDATAFTIAAVSTTKDSENPSKYLKVFWCVMLGLIPLTMLYINANLDTLKMAVMVVAVPFVFFIGIAAYGLIKWAKEGVPNENN